MHPKQFSVKVVGVTFVPTYPQNLTVLNEVFLEEGHHEEGLAALLVRNPANAHDANAIEVHVPGAVGMIGHLPAYIAEWVAPAIDSGEEWQAAVRDVLINPDHSDRPGILIEARQVLA